MSLFTFISDKATFCPFSDSNGSFTPDVFPPTIPVNFSHLADCALAATRARAAERRNGSRPDTPKLVAQHNQYVPGPCPSREWGCQHDATPTDRCPTPLMPNGGTATAQTIPISFASTTRTFQSRARHENDVAGQISCPSCQARTPVSVRAGLVANVVVRPQ